MVETIRPIDAIRLSKMLPHQTKPDNDFMKGYEAAVHDCEHLIEVAPTLTISHSESRWKLNLENMTIECNHCHRVNKGVQTTPYCPYCGCRMSNYIQE